MTWTVTALGAAVASGFSPVSSLSLTVGSTVTSGAAVAIFVQFTDFSNDSIAAHDSASNAGWLLKDTLVDATTGQGIASLYNLSLATGLTSGSGTITATFGSATIQSVGAIMFTNSVAGTPTLDGNHILDNSTGASSGNSGAGNSTSGDLVLTGIVGGGAGALGGTLSLAITNGSSITIQNNQQAAAGYADGSGVTTMTGAASVTSTWSGFSPVTQSVVAELLFAPPSAAATLMGQIVL